MRFSFYKKKEIFYFNAKNLLEYLTSLQNKVCFEILEKEYLIVRQAERADFSKLMICQIFSTDIKKTLGGSELYNTIVQFCDNL
jgi:hypothetical protein